MNCEIFDYDKSICAMVIKFIDNLEFLDNDSKASWLKIALAYKENLNELYNMYDYLNCDELEFTGNKVSLKMKKQDYFWLINLNNTLMELSIDDTKYIVAGIIDILEEILPIGTIIELKPQFVKSIYENKLFKENPKFIIVKRFLSKDDSLVYFPYAAVPYPTGELNDGKNIHLTGKSINNIIYRGFSDETDLAYICVMKSELIFKKKMHSISFSTVEERQDYINS